MYDTFLRHFLYASLLKRVGDGGRELQQLEGHFSGADLDNVEKWRSKVVIVNVFFKEIETDSVTLGENGIFDGKRSC